MIESAHPRMRRLAHLGGLVIALALSGCGIKGPLEAPPSATLASPPPSTTVASSPPSSTLASSPPSATPAASKSKDAKNAKKEPPRTADLSSEKTPTLEQSQVRGVKQQGFLPPKAPVEWQKDKGRQPGPIKRPGPPTKPDDPFFLDWLL